MTESIPCDLSAKDARIECDSSTRRLSKMGSSRAPVNTSGRLGNSLASRAPRRSKPTSRIGIMRSHVRFLTQNTKIREIIIRISFGGCISRYGFNKHIACLIPFHANRAGNRRRQWRYLRTGNPATDAFGRSEPLVDWRSKCTGRFARVGC